MAESRGVPESNCSRLIVKTFGSYLSIGAVSHEASPRNNKRVLHHGSQAVTGPVSTTIKDKTSNKRDPTHLACT